MGALWMALSASAAVNEWMERMASLYITRQMNREEQGIFLSSLGQVPVESQPWVERMARTYITSQMNGEYRCAIFRSFSKTTVERQPWMERMASLYITPEMEWYRRWSTLSSLGQVPVESQPWVERMASLYITPQMNGEQRDGILDSLRTVPVGNQPWMERMAQFVVTPIDSASEVWGVIFNLGALTLYLSTDALREEARLGIIARVNRAREEGLPLSDFFRQLFTRVRDEVRQNARINPAAAGPVGRAMEVHFASSLKVPLEEKGPSLPL